MVMFTSKKTARVVLGRDAEELYGYCKRVWRVAPFARCAQVVTATPQAPSWAVIQDEPYYVFACGSSPLIAWQRAAAYVEETT